MNRVAPFAALGLFLVGIAGIAWLSAADGGGSEQRETFDAYLVRMEQERERLCGEDYDLPTCPE